MAEDKQEVPIFAWGAALKGLRSRADTGRRGRKARHQTVTGAIDGRSLRATGRTEQMNFKVTKEIKELLGKHVGRGKMSLWLEEAIVAKLKQQGVEIE